MAYVAPPAPTTAAAPANAWSQPARGNKRPAVGATKGSRSSKSDVATQQGAASATHTSPRALLAVYRAHGYHVPDDLAQLQPIPTTRTKSGYVGVYPARKNRWQAQVNHRSIGGYASAWEAGVAVAAHLVVMARAEESQDRQNAANASNAAGSGTVTTLPSEAVHVAAAATTTSVVGSSAAHEQAPSSPPPPLDAVASYDEEALAIGYEGDAQQPNGKRARTE